MARFNFWKSYQDTILSIIEDKPRFEIPIIVFKLIILISFMQILMYLFSEFQLISQDEFKLKSAFKICEMVSLVNVLNLKQSDGLAIFVYIVAQIFMYLYFFYVGFLTIAKEYLKEFYARHQSTIIQINEFLNIYFTFYLNVFLTQFIELNCSLLFCSKKSILSSQRDQFFAPEEICGIPSWQIAISIIGLILAILTAFITNYYFRNYEFLEKNPLKRKSTFLFTFLIMIRIVITFIDFNGYLQGASQIKHVLTQIYGVVSILDYFLSIPFTDQEISKFYLITIAYFEGIVTCSNFFLLGKVINGQEMFYISILSSLLISVALQQALKYKQETILKGNWELEKVITDLDYYLEQIILLGERSGYSEESKILLQKAYKLHRSGCKISNCLCHKYPSLNMKMVNELSNQNNDQISKETNDRDSFHLIEKDINMRLIYKFVDSLFQWMFSQKCINQNTYEFEKLSLKYISFMIKYQNNPVRAYYELKVLQLKKSTFSIYFKMVTNIIGANIQHKIESSLDEEINDAGDKKGSYGSSSKSGKRPRLGKANMRSELTVSSIVDVEVMCQKFIPLFLKVIQMKLDLWTKLQNGYKTMNEFQEDAIKLLKNLGALRNDFTREMRKTSQTNFDVENSLQFQKLTQIFYLFIANDTIKAIGLEVQISELKKRDSLAEHDQLKNISLIKGDICILEISLSENFGKIVSKKDEKSASFFGFENRQDFQKINHINDLMPDFIGRVHNNMMKNYIQGTSMRSKNGNTVVYSFIKQNDSYIFPVKIHFDFSFSTSTLDFRLNGILLKNRMEQDFIIFHRSGKIVGMTKHIAKILFQEFHKLPNGDTAVSRLNALLLFPKIIKKISSSRDQIIEDLTDKVLSDQLSKGDTSEVATAQSKSASTMTTLFEDYQGSLRFTSNPYSSQRRFLSYLNKKQQISSGQLKNQYRYDEIDVLDKSSIRLLKQFEEQDFGQSTNRSHHDSSERLLSGKGAQGRDLEDINFFNNTRLVQTINSQNSKQFLQMEYKMRFEYQIQYCLLNQRNKALQYKSKKQNSLAYQNTINAKGQTIKDDLSDIFFLVRLENISTKCRPRKIKYKTKDTFVRNLARYFSSTTSILSLANQTDKLQLFKTSAASLLETTDEIKYDSKENNKNSNLSTQIIENLAPPLPQSVQEEFIGLPKKMLQLLQFHAASSGLDEELSENNNYVESPQKKNDSSFKSSNSQTEDSDIESEDINYEKLYAQVINNVYNNKQSKESLDAYNSSLENLINNFCSQKNQLLSIDPNYPVKKILQKRSLSCTFSKALEFAFTENLIILEIEKRGQKSNLANQINTSEQVLQFQQIKKEDIQIPITFRQGHDISALDVSIENIPSNNMAILESNRVQTKNFMSNVKHTNFLSQQESESILETSKISDQQQIDDASPNNQQNYLNHDTSNILATSALVDPVQLQTKKLESIMKNKTNDQSFLDVSARPILDQSNIQLHEQYQHERGDNSHLGIDNSELVMQKRLSFQNDTFIEDRQKSQVQEGQNQDEYHKAETNNLGGYQIKINQQNESFYNRKSKEMQQQENNRDSLKNSSNKVDNDENEDSDNRMQEQAIAKILNQKGMMNGKNSLQRASVNSSTRTSSSYAGVFLKEIILRSKIPKSAMKYRLILIIFLTSFVSLNITNLMIIQSDMKIFSDNVVILRQPRKFLRAYGKALFGYYLSLETKLGYLKDKDGSIEKAYRDYIKSGIEEYKTLCEQFSIQLTQLKQSQQNQNGKEVLEFTVFKQRQPYQIQLQYSLLFDTQQYQVIALGFSQQDYVRADSFLYLRQNYFDFSNEVLDTVTFLVDDTINAVNSLINKFMIVIICAIFGIIIVASISLPIIKSINFYEEKIMMIVTRINFDQSEMEKCKLSVCKQLINIDFIDWLNYNYFDIFNMQASKNKDLNQSQSSKHHTQSNPLNLLTAKKTKQQNLSAIKEATNQINQQYSGNLMDSSNLQLNNSTQIGKSFFSSKPKIKNQLHLTTFNKQKEIIQKQKNLQGSRNTSQSNDFSGKNSSINNNYLLQSKIVNQNLKIFNRFLTLLVLTTFNCIYFLVIIIYLTQSNDQLKIPVQMNQRSINLHIIQTNLKIATELLAFEYFIRDDLWPDYQIKDLDKFYQSMNDSLVTIRNIQEQNTDIIYGNNPFPADVVSKLKDIQEGRGCKYLTKYLCKNQDDELGLRSINANKARFVSEYPQVLAPDKPEASQLIEYLNGSPHLKEFVFSFQSEDELFDVYSSSINASISTVSLSIQDFLQNYLIIAGTIFASIILITVFIHWRLLFFRIQLMNLLLTIIPEEKLQEDVTLHMVRQLHRM